MTDVQHGAFAAVMIQFIDIAGTSLDDWTGDSTQYLWMVESQEQIRTLMEQLRGLLGEPGTEVMLDSPALKAMIEGRGYPGSAVVLEQDDV